MKFNCVVCLASLKSPADRCLMFFPHPPPENLTERFVPSDRGDAEGQEGPLAGTGHAQSVPAAGGAGDLHNDHHRERGCDRLHFWSHCESFLCSHVTDVFVFVRQ